MKNMIAAYTKEEAQSILAAAGFTIREKAVFDLRKLGYTQEECAEKLQISSKTVLREQKKIYNKISSSTIQQIPFNNEEGT